MRLDPPLARSNTEAWREMRYTGFGASEAPAVVGLYKRLQPMHLYLQKRREKCPPISKTPAHSELQALGHLLEPALKLIFTMRTGIEFTDREMGVWRSNQYPFMLASPDSGLTAPAFLQCKTTHPRQAYRSGIERPRALFGDGETLPLPWIVQGQQEMATMETAKHYFAVFVSTIDIRLFVMERNDDLIEGVAARERELWERIENGDPPEYDFNHPSTYDLVREQCEHTVETRVKALDTTTQQRWAAVKQLTAEIEERIAKRDAEKARVMLELGDARKGRFLDGTGVQKINHPSGSVYLKDAAPIKQKRR